MTIALALVGLWLAITIGHALIVVTIVGITRLLPTKEEGE